MERNVTSGGREGGGGEIMWHRGRDRVRKTSHREGGRTTSQLVDGGQEENVIWDGVSDENVIQGGRENNVITNGWRAREKRHVGRRE